MKILVISDLHLGLDQKGDIFGWEESEFLEILKNNINLFQIEKIILNGDVFELYKHTKKDIETHYYQLLSFLRMKEAVFLRGNHDAITKTGKNFYLIKNSKGETIYIEHGHNADFFNGTKLGRIVGMFSMSLLKKMCQFDFVNRIYLKIVKLDDEITRIPRKYNSFKYLNYALKLLKKYDVVILGHTHKLEVHKTWYLNKKKKYLNCGSCSLGRFHGIVLDTETVWYETISIDRNY
jgi:predicted phosphodiesterase